MTIIEKLAERTTLQVRRFLKKTPLDLRLAVSEDIPALIRLRLEYLKVGQLEVNALKEGLLALSLGNYFMHHFTVGDLVCWVTVYEGTVVGGGGICFNHYPPNFDSMEEETGQLINLYIEPGYRNDDLEEELLNRLLAEAEARNVSVITVQDAEVGKGGNQHFGLYKK